MPLESVRVVLREVPAPHFATGDVTITEHSPRPPSSPDDTMVPSWGSRKEHMDDHVSGMVVSATNNLDASIRLYP